MNYLNEIECYIRNRVKDQDFIEYLGQALLEICKIDSTPDSSVAVLSSRENAVFEIILRLLKETGLSGKTVRYPINSNKIKDSNSYTPAHYTDEYEPYKDRYNLVYHYNPEDKSTSGESLAFNAHIDTVKPHIAPEKDGTVIKGRGSADDKGNIISMIGIIKLLGEIKQKFGVSPGKELSFMFVIDEETGGNGSLSLALNRDLKKKYNGLVVLECCDSQVYPANRGALWYKVELPLEKISAPLVVAARIVMALEKVGQIIKGESNHPLFPDRPIQTNHGIWGTWGEHPAQVCGYVEIVIKTVHDLTVVQEVVERGLDHYISSYGDKTLIMKEGKPVVPWHFKLDQKEKYLTLKIMGSTGHMGAVAQNEGALTKASFIIEELYLFDPEISLSLNGQIDRNSLILEGGQSFVPTHTIAEVKKRIKEACFMVLKGYGISFEEIDRIVTANKLHNSAFCSDPNSDLFKKARTNGDLFGLEKKGPLKGWSASCDARLFWEEYPEMAVITTGAGDLNNAHADKEAVDIREVSTNTGFLTYLALDYTGTILTSL